MCWVRQARYSIPTEELRLDYHRSHMPTIFAYRLDEIIVLVRGYSGQQDGTKLEYCVDCLSPVALLYALFLTWGGFKSASLHSRDARGWSAPWCNNIAEALGKLRYRMKCLSWFRRIFCSGLCLADVCFWLRGIRLHNKQPQQVTINKIHTDCSSSTKQCIFCHMS